MVKLVLGIKQRAPANCTRKILNDQNLILLHFVRGAPCLGRLGTLEILCGTNYDSHPTLPRGDLSQGVCMMAACGRMDKMAGNKGESTRLVISLIFI